MAYLPPPPRSRRTRTSCRASSRRRITNRSPSSRSTTVSSPHESMGALGEHRVGKRDPRRLRALLTEVLRDEAKNGHTFITRRMRSRLPNGSRPMIGRATCRSTSSTTSDTHARRENRPVRAERAAYLALHSIRDDEARIEAVLDSSCHDRLMRSSRSSGRKSPRSTPGLRGGAGGALEEQRLALDRSFHSPLSVITGAAGTGKSALLAPLIAAIRKYEGMVPIQALTPTGKAADRLKDLGVDAMTIHRALASAGWYDWELGVWVEGDDRVMADTLIIDECSMVDVELLATLARRRLARGTPAGPWWETIISSSHWARASLLRRDRGDAKRRRWPRAAEGLQRPPLGADPQLPG